MDRELMALRPELGQTSSTALSCFAFVLQEEMLRRNNTAQPQIKPFIPRKFRLEHHAMNVVLCRRVVYICVCVCMRAGGKASVRNRE